MFNQTIWRKERIKTRIFEGKLTRNVWGISAAKGTYSRKLSQFHHSFLELLIIFQLSCIGIFFFLLRKGVLKWTESDGWRHHFQDFMAGFHVSTQSHLQHQIHTHIYIHAHIYRNYFFLSHAHTDKQSASAFYSTQTSGTMEWITTPECKQSSALLFFSHQFPGFAIKKLQQFNPFLQKT